MGGFWKGLSGGLFLEACRQRIGKTKIPCHAVEALRCRSCHPAYDLTRSVFDRQHDRGLFLTIFGAKLVPGGIANSATLALDAFFFFLALFLQRLQLVFQVVSEYRTDGRVLSRVEGISLKRFSAEPHRQTLHEHPRAFHGKEHRLPL